MTADPIYVEIRIAAPLEALWEKTQDPAEHERWDLRFSGIEYVAGTEPQRFLYRLGPIRGTGETAGTKEADGSRTSALRFWSDDPRSLIRAGSGYWRYVPDGDAVRFLTRYDYETRWGVLGAAIDRILFRRLLGWSTAWSFDRLRLWLERGIDPDTSLRRLLPRARRCRRSPA